MDATATPAAVLTLDAPGLAPTVRPSDLLVRRPAGLYCPAGDFYIDPMRRVERAVITHAHADHARSGHAHYLAHHDSAGLLRQRLGRHISLQTLAYGEALDLHGVRLSLHPAGHVLGSAQIRLAHRGQVWVASGDYFHAGHGQTNPTCAPFEAITCDCFITEATFALPFYRWPDPHGEFEALHAWWQRNAADGQPSLLAAYSLGKAQRLLAGLEGSAGPIAVHPSVAELNTAYAQAGVRLPEVRRLDDCRPGELARALVIAPPSAAEHPAMRGYPTVRSAFASGWMQLRAQRRRPGLDQGFVLSDHADWPGLLQAIAATRCERVIVMHGSEATLVRYLRERGLDAGTLQPEGVPNAGLTPDAPDAPSPAAATAPPG